MTADLSGLRSFLLSSSSHCTSSGLVSRNPTTSSTATRRDVRVNLILSCQRMYIHLLFVVQVKLKRILKIALQNIHIQIINKIKFNNKPSLFIKQRQLFRNDVLTSIGQTETQRPCIKNATWDQFRLFTTNRRRFQIHGGIVPLTGTDTDIAVVPQTGFLTHMTDELIPRGLEISPTEMGTKTECLKRTSLSYNESKSFWSNTGQSAECEEVNTVLN